MRPLALLALLVAVTAPDAVAQRDSVLAHRWVGMHLGRPLQFEFYGDTMLVLNDEHVLDFQLTDDSLSGFGDTVLTGRYRLVLGRLIFEAPGGVVTMATQSALARPLTGHWRGPLGTADGAAVELVIYASGTARWRRAPDGRWMDGEWDRATRVLTFTWTDESEWQGQYDPIGNAILFETTVPDGGTTILRRVFR
ncbi:MAG: hypothetical protein OER21_15360 [Gemmatimonadota bacterium]|nr:hypothetical protein [Gemmatimonadota bacterium]